MRIARAAAAGLFGLGVAVPAYGQVIEIDSAGVAQTFDGPTQFTATEAVAIASGKASERQVRDATTELGEAARVYGLDPALLRAVAWQESRGQMSAVSHKGALGVMQLMPSTAAELGVNPTVMSDNIRGGALYLRRQLDRFGDGNPSWSVDRIRGCRVRCRL